MVHFSLVMCWILPALGVLWFGFTLSRMVYAKGTVQRYISATGEILSLVLLAIWNIVEALVQIQLDNYGSAGFDIFFCFFWAYATNRALHQDDDNWFNGQIKKLKSKFKRFVASLQPRPAFSPT